MRLLEEPERLQVGHTLRTVARRAVELVAARGAGWLADRLAGAGCSPGPARGGCRAPLGETRSARLAMAPLTQLREVPLRRLGERREAAARRARGSARARAPRSPGRLGDERLQVERAPRGRRKRSPCGRCRTALGRRAPRERRAATGPVAARVGEERERVAGLGAGGIDGAGGLEVGQRRGDVAFGAYSSPRFTSAACCSRGPSRSRRPRRGGCRAASTRPSSSVRHGEVVQRAQPVGVLRERRLEQRRAPAEVARPGARAWPGAAGAASAEASGAPRRRGGAQRRSAPPQAASRTRNIAGMARLTDMGRGDLRRGV